MGPRVRYGSDPQRGTLSRVGPKRSRSGAAEPFVGAPTAPPAPINPTKAPRTALRLRGFGGGGNHHPFNPPPTPPVAALWDGAVRSRPVRPPPGRGSLFGESGAGLRLRSGCSAGVPPPHVSQGGDGGGRSSCRCAEPGGAAPLRDPQMLGSAEPSRCGGWSGAPNSDPRGGPVAARPLCPGATLILPRTPTGGGGAQPSLPPRPPPEHHCGAVLGVGG